MGKNEVMANSIIDMFETSGSMDWTNGVNDGQEECFDIICDALGSLIKDADDDILDELWEDRNVMFDYLLQLSDSKLKKLYNQIKTDYGFDSEAEDEYFDSLNVFSENNKKRNRKNIKEAINPEVEKLVQFNDRYFSRVDIEDRTRYTPIYKHNGKDYVYDKQNALVINLFRDDDEVKYMGKNKAPWRELDAVGLSYENWKDRDTRDEYLNGYEDDIESQLAWELDEFR